LTLVFLIAHACSPAADQLGLRVRVTAPGNAASDSQRQLVIPDPAIAELITPWLIDKVGEWTFQVIATSSGIARQVGDLQRLTFVNASTSDHGWRNGRRSLPAASL
jgi:hypothetical protein